MTHDGTYSYDYDPENRLIRVTKSGFPPPPPTTLAEALDLPLVYTTGGTREWLVNGTDYHTGLSSANSDNLNNAGESSWVETTVQAVGSGATLSFWWKSTEEGEEQNNTLDFRINGVVQPNGTLHGNSGPWEQRTYTLAAGTYTLRWTYSRDSQNDGGKGYLDGLTWDGVMPVLPEPDPAAWLTLAYRYDAAGRRIEKQYNYETITKYVYDGDHCIAEYNAYNQLRR
ncbi:MAG: hypothetical protein M1376_14795, partial [Planctomycetes bacterium]|nr:hypothetical protein [Planctomycetota bacterium]